MKRKAILLTAVFAIALLAGCATAKQPPIVWTMTPAERIHYYEMQIKNYQDLIKQEQEKAEKK
jgi:nitrous oxide reductase accessory protein NosL